MKINEVKKAEASAVRAGKLAGELMKHELYSPKNTDSVSRHDIKLELDRRCQSIIETTLRSGFPHIPLLGEESAGKTKDTEYRWVVDPIDGTVNFAYGIPHACVSIALQAQMPKRSEAEFEDGYPYRSRT